MGLRPTSLGAMLWNLANLFEIVVDAIPERTAVVVPNAAGGPRRFTFAEIEDRSSYRLPADSWDELNRIGQLHRARLG